MTTHDQYRDERFCFVLNNVRPLLPLEMAFFESAGAGKGFHSPHLLNFQVADQPFTVPVIAIFTKFDDLMTQIYDIDQDDEVNRQIAEEQVEKKFRNPLYGYTFPPRADVCFEGKRCLISRQGIDHMAQCSTLWQICITKQVIIRIR